MVVRGTEGKGKIKEERNRKWRDGLDYEAG